LVDEFRKLPQQIPAIADFENGTNNSPEGLHEGFSHCFLITFLSEEDREIYLHHAAHRKFVDGIIPHLHKALVVDYWSDQQQYSQHMTV
jgi:hypothetical protein